MSYDIILRFQQALDPSALVDFPGALHAVQAAIGDCQNAGVDAGRDPAVLLLCRHLAQVCAAHGSEELLRQACRDRVSELESHPALETLALRGVGYNGPAKRLFHAEGRAALSRLADALDLKYGSYEMRSNKGGAAVSGEITLHGDTLWVQLSLGPFGPGREINFRKVQGRDDHIGGRNHSASISELLAPARLAKRIRQELGLSCDRAGNRRRAA